MIVLASLMSDPRLSVSEGKISGDTDPTTRDKSFLYDKTKQENNSEKFG